MSKFSHAIERKKYKAVSPTSARALGYFVVIIGTPPEQNEIPKSCVHDLRSFFGVSEMSEISFFLILLGIILGVNSSGNLFW